MSQGVKASNIVLRLVTYGVSTCGRGRYTDVLKLSCYLSRSYPGSCLTKYHTVHIS